MGQELECCRSVEAPQVASPIISLSLYPRSHSGSDLCDHSFLAFLDSFTTLACLHKPYGLILPVLMNGNVTRVEIILHCILLPFIFC